MATTVAHTPRSLSHDERKAAEAAFQGRPFNEAWSQGARLVYDGIVGATRKLRPQAEEGYALLTCQAEEETQHPVGTR